MTANAEMLRALYRAAPVAVVMLDPDGRIDSVNPAAARLFGLDAEAMAGQRGDILFAVPREFDSLTGTGFGLDDVRSTREITLRYRSHGGRVLDGETVVTRIADEAGTPLGTLLMIRDVSAERSLQARLEASDIQLRAALTSANEGAFSLNLKTGLGSARGFINEFLGIASADATIRRERLLDVIDPEMRADVEDAIDALSRTPGEALDRVYRATRADGENRWLEMRGRVSEFARDGTPLRLSGTIADVTERKRLEERLAERERQLANAIEAGSCGVWELTPSTGRITPIGPIRDILGLPDEPQDIDVQTWVDRIEPEDREAIQPQLSALAEGIADTLDVEYRLTDARTGARIWLRSRGRRMIGADGEPIAAGILTDISERKTLQARLAANERLLREAVDTVNDGAWSLDIEADRVWATGLMARLLGLADETQAVPTARCIDAIPEEDLAVLRTRFQALMARPPAPDDPPAAPEVWEYRMIATDGSVVWLRGRGQVVEWSPDGHPLRIGGTVANITEEIRLKTELDQSEARLREALRGAREGAWHFDLQTRVGEVTAIISEMMGLPPRDARITFDDWAERIHPDDAQDVRDALDSLASGKTDAIDDVVRYHSETDGWIHIHVRGRINTRDAEGRPRSADGFITDISQRIETEQRLKQREQQLAEAVDAASLGLWRHDFITDTIEMRGSVAAELFSGESEAILDVAALRERIHPDDIGALVEVVAEHRSGRQTVIDTRYRLRDRHGNWVWYRVTGNLVERAPDGSARVASGVIWNIDAAQRAEAELDERRARFEHIFRATPAMMHTIDADGYIVEVSDYWLAHLGYSREEVVGRRSIDFLDAESRERALSTHLPELFESGANTSVPYRFVCRNGSMIDVLLSSFLERDRDGQPLRSYAVMTDVTALREANEKLERSNRELDRFATVASHDLQEPLRKIAAFSSLVRRRNADRLDDDGRRNLDFLVDAAHRMQRLIDDLLAYSRLASQPIRSEAVDVGRVVAQAIEHLDAAISESGARIEVGEMPTVKADAVLLTQIFQNLIGNALKYRSFATPEVDIAAHRDDGRWVFTVSDNGIGFDIKFAEKIFAPFQRLHPQGAYPGTGIGLAIVRQSVERHGGEIWVDSEPGSGATFSFSLPVGTPDEDLPASDMPDAAK